MYTLFIPVLFHRICLFVCLFVFFSFEGIINIRVYEHGFDEQHYLGLYYILVIRSHLCKSHR